jgi:hypothetical protein
MSLIYKMGIYRLRLRNDAEINGLAISKQV